MEFFLYEHLEIQTFKRSESPFLTVSNIHVWTENMGSGWSSLSLRNGSFTVLYRKRNRQMSSVHLLLFVCVV